MPRPGLSPLDDAALEAAVGGQELNVDTTTTQWTLVGKGLRRIPVPRTTMKRERTPFGACLDTRAADCEKRGGDNQTVGQCQLDGIKDCRKIHNR